MRGIFFIFIVLLLVTSCSSKKAKQYPNFSLTGKEAEAEYKKFEMKRISFRHVQFNEDSIFASAKLKEVKNLVTEVSPKTLTMIQENQLKEDMAWVVGVAWLATVFIKDAKGDVSPLYWVGAAGFMGYIFYLDSFRKDMADQFNRDLKSKFAPSVGYTFNF